MKSKRLMYGAVLLGVLAGHPLEVRAEARNTKASLSRNLAEAKSNYARIERNLTSYTRVQTELMGFSTEGGELAGYFKSGQPRKLVATYFGESGRAIEEYYFWNGRLFFCLKTDLGYKEPIGITGADPQVISKAQERFYFQNGKLIQWIDAKGKLLKTDDNYAKQHEIDVLYDARQLLSRSRKTLTNTER